MTKYQKAFLDCAKAFAQCSTAKRLKVGAVIVKEGCIISEGLNGTPVGFHTNICEYPDRDETIPEVIHAELNAIDKAAKFGHATKDAEMYCTHAPCLHCAVRIANVGIKVVYFESYYRDKKGVEYLNNHGVECLELM